MMLKHISHACELFLSLLTKFNNPEYTGGLTLINSMKLSVCSVAPFSAHLLPDKLRRALSPDCGTAALRLLGVLAVPSQEVTPLLGTLVVQLRLSVDQAGPVLTGGLPGPLVVLLGVPPVVQLHLAGSSLHWRSTELFGEYFDSFNFHPKRALGPITIRFVDDQDCCEGISCV